VWLPGHVRHLIPDEQGRGGTGGVRAAGLAGPPAAGEPRRPRNAYIREDRILPHLPALYLVLAGTEPAGRQRTRRRVEARPHAGTTDVIGYMRDRGITLTYHPAEGTLQAGTAKTILRKAS
jgi:hypothetical protein